MLYLLPPRDEAEVNAFIDQFDENREVFIAQGVGGGMSGDIIDSNDADYIKRRIREKYLGNTSVTIVMIGKCTWARKFVDWEIASSLRDNPTAGRSGLLGITLHSAANYSSKKSPDRLNDNLMDNALPGYARWKKYPTSADDLAPWIEDAFNARTERASLVDNSRSLFDRNRQCP